MDGMDYSFMRTRTLEDANIGFNGCGQTAATGTSPDSCDCSSKSCEKIYRTRPREGHQHDLCVYSLLFFLERGSGGGW